MLYPSETFTEAERAILDGRVSTLDGPVYALTNLPEAIKGAMFARYSRYPGTLRRLMVDEFAADLREMPIADVSDEGQRAAKLYESVFVGFGDDSVAQLGGAHLACEYASNILTKILQRPRIAAYLEQSTRYIAFDQPINDQGWMRYYRAQELGPDYERAMDALFAAYSELLEQMTAAMAQRFPRGDDEPQAAWERAVRAKALDSVRGLLPASTLSHMGIYASGQTYEQLVMHLLAHELPEARAYGEMVYQQLQAVIPSFLSRVKRPERGGEWIDYLRDRAANANSAAKRLGLYEPPRVAAGPSVRLLRAEGDLNQLLAALLFEHSALDEEANLTRVGALDAGERTEMLDELVGVRANRRHRPGRGLESLRYRFEVVSDYGAFRDLQRHRMLTVQWQWPTPHLGADVPEEVASAGLGDAFQRSLEISRVEYERIHDDLGLPLAATYALCLAYRMRYILDLNAREAMQMIELRSGSAGHPSYRAVALAMLEEISRVHPEVGALFTHADHTTDPRLERIASEIRNEKRLAGRS